MNNLNSILLEGNLTHDPEVVEFDNGTAVTKFSVAVDRYYTNKNKEGVTETSFFDISTWAKMGEACAKYLRKGRGVRIVGRLKQDRWTDKQGKSREKIFIVAEHVEFQPESSGKNSTSPKIEEEITDNPESVF